MEKENLLKVFEAIKSDNLKLFTSLMLSKSDLNISFGRFPILSLCYLYRSEKILSKYEKYLANINKFEVVQEYFEIYKDFKKHAKKALRLYADSETIIFPIEMIAILDNRNLLKNKYKILFKNEEILNRLQKIYNLNQKINIIATKESLVCESKKLSLKQKVLAGFLAGVLVVLSAFSFVSISMINGLFGAGTASSPIYISNEEEFITALEKGERYYVLENDVTLSKLVSVDKFSGTIEGNDHTLKLADNQPTALIQNLSGAVQNLNVEFFVDGLVFSSSYSILATNLTGNVQNCSFLGQIKANLNTSNISAENVSDLYVSVIAVESTGTISDSVVSLFADANNLGQTNAYISAFVGVNRGTISNSSTSNSKFESDTIDLAGIVAENYGSISNVVNNTELNQRSNKEWNPNSAGICMINYGTINDSKNFANVSSESTRVDKTSVGIPEVIASGIVCINYGTVSGARNEGAVSGIGDIANVLVGGIVASNSYSSEKNTNLVTLSLVDGCKSTGNIVAKSKQSTVSVGGVAAQNLAKVQNSGFEGSISAHSDIEATSTIKVFAGGVIGYNNGFNIPGGGLMNNCYADVTYVEPETNKIENEKEFISNIYGGLVGCANIVEYMSAMIGYFAFNGTNNHFATNDTIGAVGYWLIANVDIFGEVISYAGIQKASSDKTIFIEHESIDEIPEGVRIYE